MGCPVCFRCENILEKTFKENKEWRRKNNWNGCIYGSCIPIAQTPNYRQVEKDERIFIIEMNNDENKIMGIGCIKNNIRHDFTTRIYSDLDYNRYIYRSNFRIERNSINKEILDFLEEALFKGKGHLKRGQGITMINIKWNSVYSSKRKLFLPKNILKYGIKFRNSSMGHSTFKLYRYFASRYDARMEE